MPKKRTKKSSSRRKTSTKTEPISREILKNLVELQKVHTNLAEKFDSLSKQIASLLSLFESAAKSFAENPAVQSAEKDKEFLEKINKLLDQNKTIAKGLTLMEERIRERVYHPSPQKKEKPESPSGMKEPEDEFRPSISSTNTRPLPKF